MRPGSESLTCRLSAGAGTSVGATFTSPFAGGVSTSTFVVVSSAGTTAGAGSTSTLTCGGGIVPSSGGPDVTALGEVSALAVAHPNATTPAAISEMVFMTPSNLPDPRTSLPTGDLRAGM